jgi:hypothetical protein
MDKKCSLCGCRLHRTAGTYALPTVEGRSHATNHHYVAERFFGRSATRRNEQRERIFDRCPWESEGQTAVYCYECHEELLHNPVLTQHDVARFRRLVARRGLEEDEKPTGREKLAGRIRLFHEIIEAGLLALDAEPHSRGTDPKKDKDTDGQC